MIFNKPVDSRMDDLIPIKDYDRINNCFICEDGIYRDLLRIKTKDLKNMSSNDVDYDILRMQKFYKTYADDIKIIVLNFPSYTQIQQDYINRKMEQTNNPKKKYWLQIKLDELIWIENNKTTREFYMMYFANDSDMLIKLRADILSTLGGNYQLVETIDQLTKEQIIYKLNNKQMLIHKVK